MTQAINLANFSNSLDSSGQVAPTVLNAPVPISKGGTGATTTAGAASALVAAFGNLLFPVGSIYTNASNSTNPATLLGFGTWSLFSLGKMMIGYDGGSYLAGYTGGSATTSLSVANLPPHTHPNYLNDPGHSHAQTGATVANVNLQIQGGTATGLEYANTSASLTGVSIVNGSTGSGTAVTTISPYIVVYIWQRTS